MTRSSRAIDNPRNDLNAPLQMNRPVYAPKFPPRAMFNNLMLKRPIKLNRLSGFPFRVLLAVSLFAGCASSEHGLTLATVGPAPASTTTPGGNEGYLLVYSAFQTTTADFNRTPYRRQYSDYRILSSDGKDVIQSVHNDTGLLISGPTRVTLPVGQYRVVARANGYGTVTVPVVIRGGQSTLVHLEGSVWWPKSSEIHDSNPVRLPKGEIVGWPDKP